MNKNKLDKANIRFNKSDDNNVNSGVSNIAMSVMYNMYGITDDMIEEKKTINDSDANKNTVSVLEFDMATMYDMLKNK